MFAIAREAGQVQIKARFLREFHQARQAVERFLIRLVRRIHEFGELKMNPNDVRAELLHFMEIFDDSWPFCVPIILEQARFVVAVVIEAPRSKLFAGGCGDESALAPALRRAASLHPDVYIKSRASGFGRGVRFRILISASAASPEEAELMIENAVRDLTRTLGEAGISDHL